METYMKFNLFLAIFISLGLASSGITMEPQAGIVVNPIYQTGQFTTAGISLANQPSGLLPAVTELGKAGSEIAQPALISFAAGKAPWWALSTGTGYLLLFKCKNCTPALFSSCAMGAGFSSGSQITQALKNISSDPKISGVLYAAAAASCIGLSYSTNVALAQDAFFAMAQAIGIEGTLDVINKLMSCIKPTTTSTEKITEEQTSSYKVPTWIAQASAKGAEIGLQTAFVELLNHYDPITLLQAFLYEQTYRLAQKGYASANQLLRFINTNYKPLDPRKAACTLI